MTIHLVIPVKVGPEVPERLENLRNCLASAAAVEDVVVDVIDVHSDIVWDEFLPKDSAASIQVFRTPFSQWNKSIALNYAIGIIPADDIIAVVDADLLNPSDLAEIIYNHCRPGKIVFPVSYSLHQGRPAVVCGDAADPAAGANGWWRDSGAGPAWGYVEDFRSAGCYPPELGRCWGGEDVAFFAQAHKIYEISRPRIPGLYHQWHPSAQANWAYTVMYAEDQKVPTEGQEMPWYGWQDLSEQAEEDLAAITQEAVAAIHKSCTPHRWKWAVGITTAARQVETLRGTVDDLVAAGWDQITIFAEPQSPTPDFCKENYASFGGVSYKVNVEVLGAWRNWRESFISLVADNPTADFYAIVQDDVTIWSDLRKFFDKVRLPDDYAVYSPYTAGWYGGDNEHPAGSLVLPDCGWFRDSITQQLGALFTIVPRKLAKELVNWLPEEVPANRQVDVRLAEILQSHAVSFYRHSPSLADHTGVVSTLGYAEGSLNRRARDFIGARGELPEVG